MKLFTSTHVFTNPHFLVLLKALERLEKVEGVSHIIDAKAMSKDSLYGVLDANTREWTDGLFTHIIRKIIDNVRGEADKRHVSLILLIEAECVLDGLENIRHFFFR